MEKVFEKHEGDAGDTMITNTVCRVGRNLITVDYKRLRNVQMKPYIRIKLSEFMDEELDAQALFLIGLMEMGYTTADLAREFSAFKDKGRANKTAKQKLHSTLAYIRWILKKNAVRSTRALRCAKYRDLREFLMEQD